MVENEINYGKVLYDTNYVFLYSFPTLVAKFANSMNKSKDYYKSYMSKVEELKFTPISHREDTGHPSLVVTSVHTKCCNGIVTIVTALPPFKRMLINNASTFFDM